ncbi:MAG: ATP-binding protein [Verrucomicrobiales bacterium]|nr:ATP-binding protein [Verrucomicrobiales bacterium]
MKALETFSSPYFDLVFNSVATTHAAKELVLVDIEEMNSDAREGIRSVFFHCENQTPDPSARIFLMTARGAQGKTHTLVAEILKKCYSERKAFPAILQLTANVPINDVDRWLFASIFRQLESKDFAVESGFSPLRELVDQLAIFIPWEYFDGFREAVFSDSTTEEEIGNQALDVALRICRVIGEQGREVPDDEFVAALILTAFRLNPRARAWLFGAEETVQIGKLYLSNVDGNRGDRNLRNLALCVGAIDSALVIAFDQIETAWQLGTESLVQKVLSTGVGLAEGNPSVGLLVSCYFELYKELVDEGLLKETERSRIEGGVTDSVHLEFPTVEQIKLSVEKRTARLLELLELSPNAQLAEMFAPDWLVQKYNLSPLRDFFNALRNYRKQSIVKGDFLSQGEWEDQLNSKDNDDSLAIPKFDFDKLWADAVDDNIAAVVQLTDSERANDLAWVAPRAAAEFPEIKSITSEVYTINERFSTLIVDLKYSQDGESVIDRWKIALTDVPNTNQQLRDQLAEVIENSPEANIAIVRKKAIPGVDSSGCGKATILNVQPGEQLNQILESGGRAFQLPDDAWTRLRLARDFAEEYEGAEGFEDWCQQRQFFTELADIDNFRKLISPSPPASHEVIEKVEVAMPIHPKNESVEDEAPVVPEVEGVGPFDSQPGWEKMRVPDPGEDPRDALAILLGTATMDSSLSTYWCLDRKKAPTLANFGMAISGDAGTGKTQLIRSLISGAADHGAPILIFDFKNDYTGEFAERHSFKVYDLRDGIPFNPLSPVPTAPSGCQPIEHIFEVAGILGEALRLGDIQKALFRDAMIAAFGDKGIEVNEWQDPASVMAPGIKEVIEKAHEINPRGAVNLVNRLGLLVGLNLMPSNTEASVRFPELIDQRAVFLFTNLPEDENIKRAIAELLLIQAHGYMLRGEQPRALRRLFVFDEAHRASKSRKLVQMAREGRAFGLSIVAGSQFATDLDPALTGNLATKIYLHNNDGNQRRRIVSQTFGTMSGQEPRTLLQTLGELNNFEAVVINQHFEPFEMVRIIPYFERVGDA